MKSTNTESAELHASLALESVNRSQAAIRKRQFRFLPVGMAVQVFCVGAFNVVVHADLSRGAYWAIVAILSIIFFTGCSRAFGFGSGVRRFAILPVMSFIKYAVFYGVSMGVLIGLSGILFQHYPDSAMWLMGAGAAAIHFFYTYLLGRNIQRALDENISLPPAGEMKSIRENADRSIVAAILRYMLGWGLLLAVALWVAVYFFQETLSASFLRYSFPNISPWNIETIVLCLIIGMGIGVIRSSVAMHGIMENMRAQLQTGRQKLPVQ